MALLTFFCAHTHMCMHTFFKKIVKHNVLYHAYMSIFLTYIFFKTHFNHTKVAVILRTMVDELESSRLLALSVFAGGLIGGPSLTELNQQILDKWYGLPSYSYEAVFFSLTNFVISF
jgi:hypothetical protein